MNSAALIALGAAAMFIARRLVATTSLALIRHSSTWHGSLLDRMGNRLAQEYSEYRLIHGHQYEGEN